MDDSRRYPWRLSSATTSSARATRAGVASAHADLGQHLDRFGPAGEHRACLAAEVTSCAPGDDPGAGGILAEQGPGERELALCLEVPQTLGIRTPTRRTRSAAIASLCPARRRQHLGAVLLADGTRHHRQRREHVSCGLHRLQGPDDVAGEQVGHTRGCARPWRAGRRGRRASSWSKGLGQVDDGGASGCPAAGDRLAAVEQGAARLLRDVVRATGWPSRTPPGARSSSPVRCRISASCAHARPRVSAREPRVGDQGLAPVHPRVDGACLGVDVGERQVDPGDRSGSSVICLACSS